MNKCFTNLFLLVFFSFLPISSLFANVVEVSIKPGPSQEHQFYIVNGSVCSFQLPASVNSIILGNSHDFRAQVVSENIVAVKPITDAINLTTNIQMVLSDQRIVTVRLTTSKNRKPVSVVHFVNEGLQSSDQKLRDLNKA